MLYLLCRACALQVYRPQGAQGSRHTTLRPLALGRVVAKPHRPGASRLYGNAAEGCSVHYLMQYQQIDG